jgi:hypothetical protein
LLPRVPGGVDTLLSRRNAASSVTAMKSPPARGNLPLTLPRNISRSVAFFPLIFLKKVRAAVSCINATAPCINLTVNFLYSKLHVSEGEFKLA